jgi:hypothetical protein
MDWTCTTLTRYRIPCNWFFAQKILAGPEWILSANYDQMTNILVVEVAPEQQQNLDKVLRELEKDED